MDPMRAFRLMFVLVAALALDTGHPVESPWAELFEDGEEAAHARVTRRPARPPGPAVAGRPSHGAAHRVPSRPAPHLARALHGLRAPAVEVQKLPPPQSEAPAAPDDH